jgi:hypothetical protein
MDNKTGRNEYRGNRPFNGNGSGGNRDGFQKKPWVQKPLREVRDSFENEIFKSGLAGCKLGAKFCFYTNSIDYKDLETLYEKIGIAKEDRSTSLLNWLTVNCATPDGKEPGSSIKEAVEFYTGLSSDKEINRLNIYGHASLSFDFARAGVLMDENGALEYPCGIVFISDFPTGRNKFAAALPLASDRQSKIKNENITGLNPDTGEATCSGVFQTIGHFLVYYVSSKKERLPGKWYPVVTLIDVELNVIRQQHGMLRNVWIDRVLSKSTCIEENFNGIPDVYKSLIDGPFAFYNFTDKNQISEILWANGYNPRDYFPPDPNEDLYGRGAVRFSEKNSGQNRQRRYNNDKGDKYSNQKLFNYLNEVEKTAMIEYEVNEEPEVRNAPPPIVDKDAVAAAPPPKADKPKKEKKPKQPKEAAPKPVAEEQTSDDISDSLSPPVEESVNTAASTEAEAAPAPAEEEAKS